jgi:hypothetical protein
MRCASTRTKKSEDQCPTNALNGHIFCGRHMRCREHRIWSELHKDRLAKLKKVQALFRGWRIRRYLALCGPGVLKRADCVNDEDLATCEEKTRQHPLDYFGLEENGKVWWFDVRTLWDWSSRNVESTNPYTKVPLTSETRERLRKVFVFRRRAKMPMNQETGLFSERVFRKWTILCQMFRHYGFEEAHPQQFVDLGKGNLYTMFQFLIRDFNDLPRKPVRALGYCTRAVGYFVNLQNNAYILTALNSIFFMVMESKSYDVVFIVLSALYRC